MVSLIRLFNMDMNESCSCAASCKVLVLLRQICSSIYRYTYRPTIIESGLFLMDRGNFGRISLVGGIKDLDDLHECHINKDIWNGLDFINCRSLLYELGVLGDDGGVGEEISSVGHFDLN